MTQDSTQLPGPDDPVPVLSYQAPRRENSNPLVWKIVRVYVAYGFVALTLDSFVAALAVPIVSKSGGDFSSNFLSLAAGGCIAWLGSTIIIWLCCWGNRRKFQLPDTHRWKVRGALPAAMSFMLGFYSLMSVPLWIPDRWPMLLKAAIWMFAVFAYLLAIPIIVGDWLWAKAVHENAWRAEAVLK